MHVRFLQRLCVRNAVNAGTIHGAQLSAPFCRPSGKSGPAGWNDVLRYMPWTLKGLLLILSFCVPVCSRLHPFRRSDVPMGVEDSLQIVCSFTYDSHMGVAPEPYVRLQSSILIPNVDPTCKSFLSVDHDDLTMIPVIPIGQYPRKVHWKKRTAFNPCIHYPNDLTPRKLSAPPTVSQKADPHTGRGPFDQQVRDASTNLVIPVYVIFQINRFLGLL